MNKEIQISRNTSVFDYFLQPIAEETSKEIVEAMRNRGKIVAVRGINIADVHLVGKLDTIKSVEIGQICRVTDEERDKGTWYVCNYKDTSTGKIYKTRDEAPKNANLLSMMSQTWLTPTQIFKDKVKELGSPIYGVIIKRPKYGIS